MPKPSWESPRSYSRNPSSFGRPYEAMAWHQPRSVSDLAGLRAAELHHAFAARVRMAMKARGTPAKNQRVLAEKSGVEYKRLGKILGGHLNLSLRDIASMEAVFGPLLSGLTFQRVAVENPRLREQYPLGVAPLRSE